MHRFFKYGFTLFTLIFSFAAFSQPDIEQKSGFLADDGLFKTQGQPVRIVNAQPEQVDMNTEIDTFNNQAQSSRAMNAQSEESVGSKNKTNGASKPTPVDSEFQKFIRYSTGKSFKVFGADFFQSSPTTFAPIQNTPVPSDYTLGVGDEVLVRAWGSMDINYQARIDRNGAITIPTLGAITLAGVKAGDAEGVIKGAVANQYRDVTVNVSFGRLRAITVYVVGQAHKPGSYTISGFATLINALLVSGGPNGNGSMRNMQVIRGGKVVGSLDLYRFITKGDKSNDIKLLDGDTIFIPPALGFVALSGMVNTPAIYELRKNETIATVLDFAGGLPVLADRRRVFLEHIDPGKQQPRSIEEFALDQAGLDKALKNGDLLTINSITPEFANAVTLRGAVDQAMRVPFTTGMRLSNLIPNREMLITRASVQQQNDALLQGPNGAKKDGSLAGQPGNPSSNREARTSIQQQNDPSGQGPKVERGGISLAAQIGNLMDDINWNYAVIERIDRTTLSVNLIPFNLGSMLADPAGPDNLSLQPGDIVTIFSQNDIQAPISKRKIYARIEGEVNVPGIYQMSPDDNLTTLIVKAGGPTKDAYLFGTEFYREKIRVEQQSNLDKAITTLESKMTSDVASSAANFSGTATEAAVLSQTKAQAAKAAIQRLKDLKANGRLTLGINWDETNFSTLPALKLENGDKLVVPSRPDFINVFGSVDQQNSLIWRSGWTVEKYLSEGGPTSEADLENIFVLRANGTVLTAIGRGWFSSIASTELMPGDTIVVPERLNKETPYKLFINGMKDWAQILSGFGLGVAAIRVIK